MNRIKELCIQKGIEQKELSILVGVSQPTVSDWFNNKKNPRGDRLEKLSAVLETPREVILGYTDNVPPQTEKALSGFPHDQQDRAEGIALLGSLNQEELEKAVAFMKFQISQRK